MTFKHINFLDSPVMRELERISKAKGEFNSSSVESVVKKVAASKPKKKVSYKPGKDLMQDILKLADGLRAKGFEKQADSLETKFFDYKKAETHLYRAIDEDGDDVIDFAHPHAAKPISDSEHAKVPNILERHKKIVDVVNKQPTGKYGADVADIIKDAEDILGLKKKAQLSEMAGAGAWLEAAPAATGLSGVAVTGAVGLATTLSLAISAGVLTGYLANKLFSHIYDKKELIDAGKNFISELDDLEVSNQEENGTITAEQKIVFDAFKKDFVKFEQDYNKKDINSLNQVISGLNNLRKLAVRISSIVGGKGSAGGGMGINPLNWTEYFTGGDEFRDAFLAAQNFIKVADIEMTSQQNVLQSTLEEFKKTSPEEYNKITQNMAEPEAKKIMTDFAKKVPGVSQDKTSSGNVTSIAKALNNLASYSLQIGDNNDKFFTAMANIFSDPKALTVPFAQILYNLEKAGLEDIQQYKTAQDFKQNFINYWENEYKKTKTSSLKKKIFQKIAGIKGAPASVATPGVPAKMNQPLSSQQTPQARRPSPDAQEPEKGAVQRLQMILNRLGMELASKNDLKNKNLPNILISTGPKGMAAIDQFDGKWGPNTDAAVQAAAKLGIEGMTPGATYSEKPKSTDDLAAAAAKAEKNINAIAKYMKKIGMEKKIPADVIKKRTYRTLDRIKSGSTVDNTWVSQDDYDGNDAIPVTTADFISFMDLDELIKRAVLIGDVFNEAPVQAIQKEEPKANFKNKEIVDPWRTTAKASFIESVRLLKSAQQAQTMGRTKQGWREILKRFDARAFHQYQKAVSAEDADNNIVQTKNLYRKVIENLGQKLNAAKKLPDNQVISAYDLDYKLHAAGGEVAAYTSKSEPVQNQENEGTEYTRSAVGRYIAGLSDEIDLDNLHQQFGDNVMNNYKDYHEYIATKTWEIKDLRTMPNLFVDRMIDTLNYKDSLIYMNISPSQIVQLPNIPPKTTYLNLPQVYPPLTDKIILLANYKNFLEILQGVKSDLKMVFSKISDQISQNKGDLEAFHATKDAWYRWSDAITEMYNNATRAYTDVNRGVSRGQFS